MGASRSSGAGQGWRQAFSAAGEGNAFTQPGGRDGAPAATHERAGFVIL